MLAADSPTASRPKPTRYKRGVGKRANKENARTASLAVEWWDFLEAWTQASAGKDTKRRPPMLSGGRTRWRRAFARDYPLSGCFPAEPNSVSSGAKLYHFECPRFKANPQRTLEPMPPKIQNSTAAQRPYYSYTVADPQPFQGEPRGESPHAGCTEPIRRNAGASSAAG